MAANLLNKYYKYADIEEAKNAVDLWNGKKESVEHLGNFSNSVFKFETNDNRLQVIRFTDPRLRSNDEILGELEFLEHLKSQNTLSCYAIASKNELLVESFQSKSGVLYCSSLNYVHGLEINDSSIYWKKDFFTAWGENLAAIHLASKSFQPKNIFRWNWDKEHLIQNAKDLLSDLDLKSLSIFYEVMAECACLEITTDNFGLIHADHAPQNFIFDPNLKKITAIDFGNCCYHWYISDLAISLSTVRRKENREEIKNGILEGYSRSQCLPNDYEKLIDLFIRLRVLYVYLDRLHRFGNHPTIEQAKVLMGLQERVHSQQGW